MRGAGRYGGAASSSELGAWRRELESTRANLVGSESKTAMKTALLTSATILILLVVVCPASAAAGADTPAVREVNRAVLAATAPAGGTTPAGGPYGLAQTPYMGWRRCADAARLSAIHNNAAVVRSHLQTTHAPVLLG